jgi:hypothetical protein
VSSIDIPPDVADHLGYYVYLYIDPRTNKPFYVGKGIGRRVLAHLGDEADSAKTRTLADLSELGLEPRLEILTHGLRDEETAFRIEAAVIDLFGLAELTNEVRGWKSVQFGRMTLRELSSYYAAAPVEVAHSALLIRVNKQYRHAMSPDELYEATRGVWKLGVRREKARYAMAVFEGVVKEVYEIESWHPAGTTNYTTRSDVDVAGRWEFLGNVAPPEVRETYLDHNVRGEFRRGAQSPVKYVNC